ncbi:MAG: ABC transporter permease [Stellaceae bacterium]
MTAEQTSDKPIPLTDVSLPVPLGGQKAWVRILSAQSFWVSVAVTITCVAMSVAYPRAFGTEENFFNITRNFSFIAIMALGETLVIITGGIDLSVGSIMGVAGVVLGLSMAHGFSLWPSAGAAILAGAAMGLVNGGLISYLRLSAFVVTLGTLSIGRSLALAISNNKMFYEFGPDQGLLLNLGGGATYGVANSVWILLILAVVLGCALKLTAWGRHIYAIGGNESAARLTGVAVDRVRLSVYMLSGVLSAIAAILMVGWLGSVTNALGLTYELRVIASSVIGGVNLMGGEGGAYGTIIGSVLIEVIRNTLNMAGVDPYWQGTFVGLFIIFAVLLEKIRGLRMR